MASAAAAVPAAPAPAKKGGMLPILLVAVIASAAAGGGVFFMTKKSSGGDAHGAAEAPAGAHGEAAGHGAAPPAATGGARAPAQYLPLTPSIVVNLDDQVAMRYLQVDVELMSRDGAGLEAVKLHMPRIRNSLMLLFAQQKFDAIITREGKEALQAQALAEVQKVLKEETGAPAVEALFFTNFVMQ